jgi:perosamine synthetase
MRNSPTRRGFLEVAAAAPAGLGLFAGRGSAAPAEPLALLGGKPVRKEPFPAWPRIEENDEKAWINVLRKKGWCRLNGDEVNRFETAWAQMLGAKHVLAVANGTSALITSLAALGIGPGDEVLVPPYTFVATVNAVLIHHALPVFVDIDPETFQIDARRLESAINDRTACLLPVHIGGAPADLDAILATAGKHKLPVIEDACQAHLGEWRKRKLGTLGDLGCFSFQVSKNLSSGEGGAIVTNRDDLIESCRSFQNNGRGKVDASFAFVRNGANLRMTEFQGALLSQQLTRLEAQARTREQNAAYLTALLREIPGVHPARTYEGCTRNAYHLYMFRYEKTHFANLPRAKFLEALHAEGIPCSSGYSPLYHEPFLKATLQSRAYRAIYPPERLAEYEAKLHCPANDRLCEEAVWFTQTMFLGPRSDMDQIAEAIRKVQVQADRLARA